jgi:hypothetical protein
MYAIIVENNDAYDVIGLYSSNKPEVMDNLDTVYATGATISSMDASAYKQTALHGATFNGSSFSGGIAGPNLLTATQEQLDSFNLYAFLSNNVVVARVAVPSEGPKAEMFAAANAAGMILAKIPDRQTVYVGQTYNWDGTSFSSIA